MTVSSKTRQEIAAGEKAGDAVYKKVDPQPPVVKDVEQQLTEARRKIAQLEKKLEGSKGGPEFIIESPVLHDPEKWAELNNGKNAKALRAFMLPSYLQVHAQPLVEETTGRVKHIKGGSVELIRGKGSFESEDWARYLSLNYPEYVISRKQENGTYRRYVVQVVVDAREEFEDEEFYYDELPQTARTLAAANPGVQVLEAQVPTLVAAAAPVRSQERMPQELKDKLAARVEETNAPVAVLAGV